MKQFKLTMEEQQQSKKKEEYESENETSMSLTKDFCGYTSAHGLERIMSSKQWIRKTFWSLLFIAAVVVLGLQVYTLFRKYQRRPLVTLVTLKSDTVSLKKKDELQYWSKEAEGTKKKLSKILASNKLYFVMIDVNVIALQFTHWFLNDVMGSELCHFLIVLLTSRTFFATIMRTMSRVCRLYKQLFMGGIKTNG